MGCGGSKVHEITEAEDYVLSNLDRVEKEREAKLDLFCK